MSICAAHSDKSALHHCFSGLIGASGYQIIPERRSGTYGRTDKTHAQRGTGLRAYQCGPERWSRSRFVTRLLCDAVEVPAYSSQRPGSPPRSIAPHSVRQIRFPCRHDDSDRICKSYPHVWGFHPSAMPGRDETPSRARAYIMAVSPQLCASSLALLTRITTGFAS